MKAERFGEPNVYGKHAVVEVSKYGALEVQCRCRDVERWSLGGAL